MRLTIRIGVRQSLVDQFLNHSGYHDTILVNCGTGFYLNSRLCLAD